MIAVGLDIGSITTKAAAMEDVRVLGTRVGPSGYNAATTARRIFDDLLTDLDLDRSRVSRVVSTGYGRGAVDFADKAVTEIVCHGTGAFFLDPGVRSIIDIGGQDSKALVLDERGKVINFAMNDKCAAGTGRFLDVLAHVLELTVADLGPVSEGADRPASISNTCTVFAESEVISLIAKGERRANIVAGIHEAIAVRVSSMARRVGVKAPLMMTGGVARNAGVVRALEARLELPVSVRESAQVIGAIGAALLAMGLKAA